MLSLAHVEHTVPAQLVVEVDVHIPLSIAVGSVSSDYSVYWRAKSGGHTLLEVELSSATGQIRSVTLTAITAKSVTVIAGSLPSNTVPALHGVPCINVSSWPSSAAFNDRFFDAMVDVHLCVVEDGCSLQLGGACLLSQLVVCGALRFGFDEVGVLRVISIPLHDVAHRQTLVGFSQR